MGSRNVSLMAVVVLRGAKQVREKERERMGRVKQPKIISGYRYRGLRGGYGSLPTYTSPGRWIRYEARSHTNNDGLLR
uniref:AP2/ERF domain-containing protein n=1 Tax=Elaeophora elaphi TaxID=1147741 RepID=A0A0R3S2G6_9BILA